MAAVVSTREEVAIDGGHDYFEVERVPGVAAVNHGAVEVVLHSRGTFEVVVKLSVEDAQAFGSALLRAASDPQA